MQLRRSMQRQRRRVMITTYLKVRGILNPEQQKKFDREFVPPKFRDEAHQAEQRRGDDAVAPTPLATETATP
jgi:Spy/CpxP family protein refolding chaperone